uniref:PSP proline-rich domain-containing protein n=1 Tax=Percolomonas cosmopolitus TaxID=63605 RepID=A0A7S1KPH0_9EUKA|mmetsp:Transcript_3421/g.13006  ORF Transcript_3421/g.13006 Transcript_3421/m.13006 type:complete len:617 (+) Transcript_3421:111-1961(+)|eukprot:CAMPEP_0117435784 /NCGR_PEP_ID=MMETSP0759-20121206/662_1 /TAXON_ID=63605 /ORGANISM="Percolomonas cosmopolitus, Strain WS" /LENGTH=616 /DNA_ID=CAMNT_0005227347 /DNA_START=54 /DNA_END=1904 /DNA_ORIENTATION=-
MPSSKNKRKRRGNKKKRQQLTTADLLQNTILYQKKPAQSLKMALEPHQMHTDDDVQMQPKVHFNNDREDSDEKQEISTTGSIQTNVVRAIPSNKQKMPVSTAEALRKTAQLDKNEMNLLKETMGDTFHEIMSKYSFNSEEEKDAATTDPMDVDSEKEEWESDSENDFMDSEEEDDFDYTGAHQADQDEDEAERIVSRLSRKKLKRLAKYSVAELKQYTMRPEVVEAHDENAPDPLLLVHLKSHRNTVPVPRHWSDDRKYLSSKRGYEKPPFELPDFIKNTGVQEVREKYEKKLQERSAKTRARDRMLAKLSKTDIDYQILHDAFFKYQKKPSLTIHGDIYFEGKEHQMNSKQFKPGELSEELRNALGMPEGAPPPWLIHMQKHGPPPSYPHLKIPGLNTPIPQGAKWGYHPGGWGRPPLDSQGKPLYGDVFGTGEGSASQNDRKKLVEHWGELVDDEKEEEESSSEEEEEVPPPQRKGRQNTERNPAQSTRAEDVRKNMVATVTTEVNKERPKQLFTVLEEEKISSAEQDGILNTQRKYIIPDAYMRQSAPSGPKVSVEHLKTDMEIEQDDFMAQKEEQRKEYAATEEEKHLVAEETRKRKRKDQEKERARKKFKL